MRSENEIRLALERIREQALHPLLDSARMQFICERLLRWSLGDIDSFECGNFYYFTFPDDSLEKFNMDKWEEVCDLHSRTMSSGD